MKKTFIWLLASLLFTLVGCVEGLHESGMTETSSEQLPDLTAGFAEGETRTYVESGKYLRWHEDDRLTAFYGNTLNRQYKFNGATGDNSGSFSYVSSGNLETGNALDRIYAVYPYDETATITDDGQISMTLPAVQTYAENSFGRGANTMLAVTENVEDTFLGFKNVCGYLKLKLYNAEGATIKSIEVKGNDEEKIAGAATATIAFGGVPQLTMADDATTAITLDCGDGVALGTTAEAATEFWVVIPETTFDNGITITVTDTEGGVFEKSTTKEVDIERNSVQPMAALGVEFLAPVVKPANNEIWYTNGSTTQKSLPSYIRFGGATIVSNSYDASKECWVITFSGEVTEIGNSVFKQCSSLSSVTIPESVTEIGDYAFQYCSSLSSVTIGNSVTSIGMYAFFECSSLSNVTIPNSVTEINGHAFAYCSSLSSVTIGDSVTSIGYAAFRDCSNLSSVTIPDSVTEIGDEAFMYCSSLSSVTIGDSITSIGEYAFNRCSSLAEFKGKFASEDGRCLVVNGVLYSFAPVGLTTYTIPDSVTSIGDTAFRDCSNLSSVTIGDSVTEIGDEAFDLCSNLSSVTIGDSVTSIGDTAFGRCSSLSNITIPDSVTEVGGSAFSGCSSLSSITIPDSVSSVADCTFYDCSSLMSVTIGDSVTSIGHAAFYGCKSLASVYCKPTTPPALIVPANGVCVVFDGNNLNRKIYVPTASIDAYNAAEYWSDYKSCIVSFASFVPDVSKPEKTEIWYISTDGKVVTPYATNVFGANIVSNTYENGMGVIKFDAPVTLIGRYAFMECNSLANVTIPDSVTTIGEHAFESCDNLTSVTIPDSVTKIEDYAFYYCYSLTSVTIPDSVTWIGNSAFERCKSLISVTIGDSVEYILNSAFCDCNSLASVYCKATTPPRLADFVFQYYVYPEDFYYDEGYYSNLNCRIYVPIESVDAYCNADKWFNIVGYDF